MNRIFVIAVAMAGLVSAGEPPVERWPQFRGPGGLAVGDDASTFPTRFSASDGLLWSTSLPSGHGSPCIWGDRIFVTAFDAGSKKLEVIAINRRDGGIVWRSAVPTTEIEEVHAISSPANSTPTTDGERVYVYFGSYGLLAFDWDGRLVWEHPLGVAKSPFGTGSSPVIAGDLIVINRDFPPEPYLLAVKRSDGKLAWKFMLEVGTGPGPKTSHATPLVWKDRVVLNRPGSVSAHSLADGSRIWWVAADGSGTSTLAATDDRIYAAAYSPIADLEGAVEPEPFTQALGKYDANGDGALSRDECPEKGLYLRRRPGVGDDVPGAHFTIKLFFGFADSGKDGLVDEADYNRIFERLKNMPIRQSGLLAIRPDGDGDLSLSSVQWNEPKGTPEVPAPLAYRGRVYTISNGGILTCVEAQSGRVLYRGRVRAPGAYYASPVAAGRRVVVASAEGVVTVLGGGETLEVQSNNDLGEAVFGTPAPGQSALYVRSLNHLWAFGTAEQLAEARGRGR